VATADCHQLEETGMLDREINELRSIGLLNNFSMYVTGAELRL
jgi:hypothetical protein